MKTIQVSDECHNILRGIAYSTDRKIRCVVEDAIAHEVMLYMTGEHRPMRAMTSFAKRTLSTISAQKWASDILDHGN